MDNFVLIPSGTELIRRYKDNQKWISSSGKMCIPSSRKNMEEIKIDAEIKSFYISKYPVTQALYNKIIKGITVSRELEFLPVVNVSWHNSIQFCNLLSKENGLNECYSFIGEDILCDFESNGYRLPTDAEWQYACKAGSNKYHYGIINDVAWYVDNSEGEVHEVGKKAPNDYGLYDMLGNVWEWCWDLYDEKTYGSYRIFRGGSWAEEARGCGATSRRKSHPTFATDELGFRLAKSYISNE